MGILSGKDLNGNIPAGSRMSDEVMGSPEQKARFTTRQNATVDKAVAEYLEVAKKHNLDVCQIAIAFTIRKAYMSSSIIGATTMEQLKLILFRLIASIPVGIIVDKYGIDIPVMFSMIAVLIGTIVLAPYRYSF